MTYRIQSKRLALFQWLLVGAFAALAGWLGYLQGIRHEELKKEADENTHRTIFLAPRRGDILDINRNILATSVFVKTVCANPQLVAGYEAPVARAVAPLLNLSEQDVLQRLMWHFRRGEKGEVITNQYVVLKRKVPVETWQRIQQTMTNLTFGVDEKKLPKAQQAFFRNLRRGAIGTDPEDDQLRVYPNQALAAHLLGFVGATIRTNGGRRFTTLVGVDGIESTYDSDLRGVRGWRLTETDHSRHELVDLREQDVAPHDGLNVVLTLDSAIQHMAEEALASATAKHSPLSASAIVMRPRTGEILALAVLPNFDPNDLGHSSADALRNHAICDQYEPGSTFKIVVVSGALNEGVVRLSDQFDCEHGSFRFGGVLLHDHHPYDVLSVENIITKSSNIGAAKIGIQMGAPILYRYITAFGFNQRTGVPLNGESAGTVHPLDDWYKVSIAQIPMGQGVAVTPLQMVLAMSAIANSGQLMRPMLVDRLEDRDGRVVVKFGPQVRRRVIREATAQQMVQALKTVVSPGGTAPKAALEHYTVAGKTGTAQKARPHGYYSDRFFSSFIGFFPADAPELCIGIFLDDPKGGHFGGEVAAPFFKQIAERAANYLTIKPDRDAEAAAGDGLASEVAHRPVRTAAARPAPPAND